ncbi:MAG: O-methyltransferase [Bacteroidota bacterium]|nr:O-methyltransferase [Candidatus Kapabacteria bacterium]MCS7303429.1 O-methyltransferase [Candidatus Kapabacteria bacterium]MCX7937145.1 O-methyltransferase [Chlorobiota bacterium]MDW8075222.1 O-methyltransferase [Bacteroidota bacterium]MDW8271835.1 O-methyltransferase [Bacteroidota bacterium]
MSATFTPVTTQLAAYIESLFSAEDAFLQSLLRQAEAAGMPPIHISGAQGAILQVMLRAIGARRVLEIGSLGGYSAIIMARALPPEGKVVCFEINPTYCAFIQRQAEQAGLSNVIEVRCGNALNLLDTLPEEPLFDAVFIDADKPNYVHYLERCYPRVRQGGLIIADNTLAWGHIAEPEPTFEPANVRALQEYNRRVATHPGLCAALIPAGDGMTVAVKL